MCLCLFFTFTDHRVVNIRLSIHQKSALWSLKCMKFVFRPGLRPGPRWGSSRRSPSPLIGWGGGNPLPILHPPWRLRRLGLVAPANWGGVSILQGGWKALTGTVLWRLPARLFGYLLEIWLFSVTAGWRKRAGDIQHGIYGPPCRRVVWEGQWRPVPRCTLLPGRT